MTSLLTIPQEMFFVILTLVFIVALIGDFSKARIFRFYRNTPNPWKQLAKDVKVFVCILVAFFTWAADKMSGLSGGGEWLSVPTLESMESGYYDSLPEEETGITWAVLSGHRPFTSNAVLVASQFTGGFACVGVTNIQLSVLDAPEGAIVYTNWPYAVARHSVLLPQGCLPESFTFGGRAVTNLYIAASGMLSFDGPKSSPIPSTNGIPDGTAANYIAILQTPSDIVPTNGVFWYALGTDSSVFTWKDVFLGQDTNCLATVQAELFVNGDFTCRYYLPSLANSYAQLTNVFLIGSQNNLGGETVLHTNALLAIHPSYLPAFELRWKSLAGLNPAVADQDDDSLTTADELFIHRTDPRRKDSDGDGLTDPAEITAMTDPLNPDTNNDGIPDGIDLTGYSLSDSNLVFKLINNIAPSVDPFLDSDYDGWADWLELRFGTDPNYFYSTPDGLDNLFSVTVTLATPPPETGVLAVGTNRVLIVGSGSWTFWRSPGEAHPVSFTSPHGVPPSFQIILNRPSAARYDTPQPDGKDGSFGKVALPLITFDPEIARCCHEARTEDFCETYTAIVTPQMPGTYAWETYGRDWFMTGTTWTTNTTNAVSAGHDIDWIRLRFTPSGASAYRESWVPVNTHCSMAGVDTNNPDRVAVNNNDDDADGTLDNADTDITVGDQDLQPLWPLGRFDGTCCPCSEHQPFASAATLAASSQSLALYTDSFKTNAFSGTIHAGEAVHVEGLTPSTEPYAEKLIWQWTEDNETKSVTNALTVLSVRIFPDLDTDDDVDAADIAGLSSLSSEHGWLMPAVTNVLRKLRFRTDVGLQGGAYTLSLAGDAGAFRVWPDNSGTNAAPLLSCGQVITNGGGGVTFLVGEDTDLYVEVVSNGMATITYAYIGEGGASNITCSALLKMTVAHIALIEDETTDYNFSPSLGETAQVRAAVIPQLPLGGMPGCHFKIEIIRETENGNQHIDWLDVTDEPTYGWARTLDFSSKLFVWDGVPDVFGSSAGQATGTDVFSGLSGSASRILPAVTLNEPVPPPLYTAVASIRRNSDGMVLCEARKRIFVQQVVKITYDADAITMTKAGFIINNTNGVPTYLISPMSDTEWNTQRARILTIAQAFYDATEANVRFVDANITVAQPYSFLNMEYSAGPLGFASADFLNMNPSDSGKLCSYIENTALNYYLANESMSIPITPREIGNLWAYIVTHECGHLFGLVAPGDVLDGSPEGTEGDACGWHNRFPSGQYVMNPGGGTNDLMQMIGRTGPWYWKNNNANYLKFVIPKE